MEIQLNIKQLIKMTKRIEPVSGKSEKTDGTKEPITNKWFKNLTKRIESISLLLRFLFRPFTLKILKINLKPGFYETNQSWQVPDHSCII